MAKKMLNRTQRGALKAAACLCSTVITLLGFGGCCRDEAVVEYGVVPLYGPVAPDYGVIQAPYEPEEGGETQDSDVEQHRAQQISS